MSSHTRNSSVPRSMSEVMRQTLIAVRNGCVVIDQRGFRYSTWPGISYTSLSAAYRRGLWEWPLKELEPGDRAELTPAGTEALVR